MEISTGIVIGSGLGAVASLYWALKPDRRPAPIPPPPQDAGDDYGLPPLPPLPPADSFDGPKPEEAAEDSARARRPGRNAETSKRQRGPSKHRAPGWEKTGMRDLVFGLGLLCAAVVPLVVVTNKLYALPVTAVLGWIGLILVRRGGARQHGIAVERSARRSVKLPAGWMLDESVPVHGRGDADLVVTDPDGERYVIEIKSNQAVKIRKPWFGGKAEVRSADGSKLPRDPLAQVVALAGILHGHPVLWFPKGAKASIIRIDDPEVIVVQGNWRQLRKAIGAGGGWMF
jgi:hypothetical protein